MSVKLQNLYVIFKYTPTGCQPRVAKDIRLGLVWISLTLSVQHHRCQYDRFAVNVRFFRLVNCPLKVDIDALIVRYADPAYWSKALREEGEPPLS